MFALVLARGTNSNVAAMTQYVKGNIGHAGDASVLLLFSAADTVEQKILKSVNTHYSIDF